MARFQPDYRVPSEDIPKFFVAFCRRFRAPPPVRRQPGAATGSRPDMMDVTGAPECDVDVGLTALRAAFMQARELLGDQDALTVMLEGRLRRSEALRASTKLGGIH